MNIQEESYNRANEILKELENTPIAIERSSFPLFLGDEDTRTRPTLVWKIDHKEVHYYELIIPDKKLLRVTSRINLLNLLTRFSLNDFNGLEETLNLFQVDSWPDRFPNSVKFSTKKILTSDLSHKLKINELELYDGGDYGWDNRDQTKRADAIGGILLAHFNPKNTNSLVRSYSEYPSVLTVQYDCEDMNQRYDILKTSLVGIMLALNSEVKVDKE